MGGRAWENHAMEAAGGEGGKGPKRHCKVFRTDTESELETFNLEAMASVFRFRRITLGTVLAGWGQKQDGPNEKRMDASAFFVVVVFWTHLVSAGRWDVTAVVVEMGTLCRVEDG